jgi:hypothetical protein
VGRPDRATDWDHSDGFWKMQRREFVWSESHEKTEIRLEVSMRIVEESFDKQWAVPTRRWCERQSWPARKAIVHKRKLELL